MKLSQLFSLIALIFSATLTLTSQSFHLTESDFTVSGTSNIHDWVSDVTQVTWDGDFTFSEDGLTRIEDVNVTIPVTGIVSSKGRIMDKKTYAALQSESYPNITYSMTNCTLRKDGTSTVANTKGRLTIAGQSQTVAIVVRIDQLANGNLKITGDYTLKMTDYGVDPPTALLGTLTTGDEVSLHFDLIISPL